VRPDSLLHIELMEDLRSRRSLVLKLLLPVILVVPLTITSVPEAVRLAGLPLIALFLGVLGASVGLTRLKEQGLTERLGATPVPRARMIRQYLLANAAMDGVQMLVPAIIVIASVNLGLSAVALVAAALALSIFLANALGVLVSAVAGGSGEVHLFSALCVLGVAGISGLFSGEGGSILKVVSEALPFGLVGQGLANTGFGEASVSLLVSFHVTIFTIAGVTRVSGRIFRGR